MKFYIGLHQIRNAQHFERCFLSITRLRRRRGPFSVKRWIMDSGAFTEISRHGEYRHSVKEYAQEASKWEHVGRLEMIVSQDYMCEDFILKRTGMTVGKHQRLTVDRYRQLLDCGLKSPIMPVLQGYQPEEYLRHLDMYGELITDNQRVGVGSVCKRNSKPDQVIEILKGIKKERPTLKLHGFGLKLTTLGDRRAHRLLYSSDSMSWSFAARRQGRDQNDWREAMRYVKKVEAVLQ